MQQQSQVYALEYGLADGDRKDDMIRLIAKSGKASEQSFAYRVLKTMFAEGEGQWAMDYMRKNWGAQTRLPSFNGAWHEGWDLSWGSTSHAWSSGPTALLTEKILGIEPTAYGWSRFVVRPVTADLQWAKGTVSTMLGDISAEWRSTTGGHFTLMLIVPKGTVATVYLPTEGSKAITVGAGRHYLSR